MNDLKKSGFTLMELLVYMAIVGIVVVIAGEAFSNSTKFRIRTDNMIKATQEAENVAMLFKQDLEQMGAKISKESNGAAGASDVFSTSADAQNVYMNADDPDNPDLSSYNLTVGTEDDELTFRRFRYNEDGQFVAVEEIGWFVVNKTLKRYCRTISGTADADVCPSADDVDAAKAGAVDMATEVSNFRITPAMPGVKSTEISQVFPHCTSTPCTDEFRLVARDGGVFVAPAITSDESHQTVMLSGLANNYDNENNQIISGTYSKNELYAIENVDGADSWMTRCSEENNHFTLYANAEYEISFNLTDNDDNGRMFVPETDHMAVGFRTQAGAKPAGIDDFIFFPPSSATSSGIRKMQFTVPNTIENVCLAFTFACFSPVVSSGVLTISELKLKKVETANYSFNYADSKEFSIQNKERVTAFRLELQVSRGAKNGKSGETGAVNIVIPTPSNGPND